MSNETRVDLFRYNKEDNIIEYGDISVKTGGGVVDIQPSSGEIFYNGTPIGGGGGTPAAPFLSVVPVVVCSIGVPGDPNEFSQTIRVPMVPFILDMIGVTTGDASPKILTLEVIGSNNVNLIFPMLTTVQNTDNVMRKRIRSAWARNFILGASIGKKEVDPLTGNFKWVMKVNVGSIIEAYPGNDLKIGVTFDISTTSVDSVPFIPP